MQTRFYTRRGGKDNDNELLYHCIRICSTGTAISVARLSTTLNHGNQQQLSQELIVQYILYSCDIPIRTVDVLEC